MARGGLGWEIEDTRGWEWSGKWKMGSAGGKKYIREVGGGDKKLK